MFYIQALLNRNQTEDLKQANTAVFYSVFATQRGGRGRKVGVASVCMLTTLLESSMPEFAPSACR